MGSSLQVLSLPLFNRRSRPQFVYRVNDIEVTALFDTGAATPVWCSGEEDFCRIYTDATKMEQSCEIAGFGEMPVVASVYRIPEFTIISESARYCIRELTIAVCDYPKVGCDIVLSDTMFSKTDTFIHRLHEKYIEFMYERDFYQCAIMQRGKRFSITTFSQDYE